MTARIPLLAGLDAELVVAARKGPACRSPLASLDLGRTRHSGHTHIREERLPALGWHSTLVVTAQFYDVDRGCDGGKACR
jgi:hypothetical protein